MVRFILHTILILVVSQLTNVVMGLVMTESEQEHFQQILIQAERYVHDQEHYQNHYSDCILPQQNGMSLRRSQLPSQIRILLEGIPLEYACINNNGSTLTFARPLLIFSKGTPRALVIAIAAKALLVL